MKTKSVSNGAQGNHHETETAPDLDLVTSSRAARPGKSFKVEWICCRKLKEASSVYPQLIARRWVIRGNWPYCWWRCSRVSRFSIYVVFSIIKDSYHTLVFDFDIFSIASAHQRGRMKQGFSEIKLMMTHVSFAMILPICLFSLSYQSSFGGDENTQKFSILPNHFPPPERKSHRLPSRKKKDENIETRFSNVSKIDDELVLMGFFSSFPSLRQIFPFIRISTRLSSF